MGNFTPQTLDNVRRRMDVLLLLLRLQRDLVVLFDALLAILGRYRFDDFDIVGGCPLQ
jgi:hypothetical protein